MRKPGILARKFAGKRAVLAALCCDAHAWKQVGPWLRMAKVAGVALMSINTQAAAAQPAFT